MSYHSTIHTADEAPHPYVEALKTPPGTQLAMLQVLEACGARFEKRRIRILSAEESALVRSRFTQRMQTDYWKYLKHEEGLEIERLYPNITAENYERLHLRQIAPFARMELHHTCQIMTCPIDRSPHRRWQETLKWWEANAHYDLTATHPVLHALIHRVQDYRIEQAFGRRARMGERTSGQFIGELEITTMPGQIWNFPRPALELSAKRIIAAELARKAKIKEKIRQDQHGLRLPDDTAPSRPIWHRSQAPATWSPLMA